MKVYESLGARKGYSRLYLNNLIIYSTTDHVFLTIWAKIPTTNSTKIKDNKLSLLLKVSKKHKKI